MRSSDGEGRSIRSDALYPALSGEWEVLVTRNELLSPSRTRSRRGMEDERAVYGQAATEGPGLFTFNYQMNLSELWIGSMYETLRMLKERKLMAPAMRAPRRCAATRPMSSANLLSKPRSSNPRSHRPLN
jgi:hypothetical protein